MSKLIKVWAPSREEYERNRIPFVPEPPPFQHQRGETMIQVAHGFKHEPTLDEISDAVETICEATGTTIRVTGGMTYSDGTVELDCTGDQISQASANALARHFTQPIPVHEEDMGDVITFNKNRWKR